jgi:hypothetical protein
MRNLPTVFDVMDDMLRVTPSWAQSYRASTIPADGTIISQAETIVKRYRVKYQDDGTISYIPIKETKDDEQERVSD